MTADRGDLDDLLAVVDDIGSEVLAGTDQVDLAVARSTPLLDLVADLVEAEVPEPLGWAFEVVESVARHSASWGFVLASRYSGQFATAGVPDAPVDCFFAPAEVTDDGLRAGAAPLAAGPVDALVVSSDHGTTLLREPGPADPEVARTGLAGARLTAVLGAAGRPVPGGSVASREWPTLVGAVTCGLGAAMTAQSVGYTREREQFGAPIATFPGLRALVGAAAADIRRARSLLHAHALGAGATPLPDALALAADAVLRGGVETVQTLGGYGYIDEYPVAGMLRDAVSLRARLPSAVEGWRAAADLAYRQAGGWEGS